MGFTPAGFDAARVRQGLRTAMNFGAPSHIEDQATFYIQSVQVAEGARVDDEGIPFDPSASRVVTTRPVTVPCAVDIDDSSATAESFGSRSPGKATITILDEEYAKVKGFKYVVCGGDRYYLSKVDPPVGLGSIDVWTLVCIALDDR